MKHCMMCGEPLQTSSRFCLACGALLDETYRDNGAAVGVSQTHAGIDAWGAGQGVAGQGPGNPAPRRSSGRVLGAVAVTLMVLLGVGGGVWWWSSRDASTPVASDVGEPVPSTSPSPTPVSPTPTQTSPQPVTTIVITETPTPADVPSDPTPLPPPPPTPEPVPALSSNVTAALALSNSEARQVLYDESVDAQRYVEPGYWYPVISTKCAPLTRYLDIASASTGQISIPDGVDETYASGVGSRRILAFIRALEDEYGRDFVHTFNQYDVSAALQSGDEDAWASLERVCGSRDEPMWITLYTERPYSTVDAALAWCPANGVPRGECGAWPVLIPGGRAKYYE